MKLKEFGISVMTEEQRQDITKLTDIAVKAMRVDKSLLFKSCRKREIVYCRTLIWAIFMENHPKGSWAKIAGYFGLDGVTAYHAMHKHKERMAYSDYYSFYHEIRARYQVYLGVESEDYILKVRTSIMTAPIIKTYKKIVSEGSLKEKIKVKGKEAEQAISYTKTVGFIRGYISDTFPISIAKLKSARFDTYRKSLMYISLARVFGDEYPLSDIPGELYPNVLQFAENRLFGIQINEEKETFKVS